MEKLELYNMALDLCGQAPLDSLHEGDEKDQTEKTLDMWFKAAYRKASHEMSWPFLISKLSFEMVLDEETKKPTETVKEFGEMRGYNHSYHITESLEQLSWANGDRYMRAGDYLLTDSDDEPEAWGVLTMADDPDTTALPDDFSDLVAIALAYYASVRLSPDQTTRSSIYYLYKDRCDELMEHYSNAERKGAGDIYGE